MLDVEFQPDTGPKADIGPISLSGLKDMNESFVRRRLLLHQGEQFSPQAIETARQDLSSIGVFSVVRADPAAGARPQRAIADHLRPDRAAVACGGRGVAYSTDLGVNFTTGWHDRNLFGNAEQLNLTAAVQLGGNAVTKPGYQVGAQFLKPDFLARDQTLEVRPQRDQAEPASLRPDRIAGENRAQPQIVAALDRQPRLCRGSRNRSSRKVSPGTTIWSASRPA